MTSQAVWLWPLLIFSPPALAVDLRCLVHFANTSDGEAFDKESAVRTTHAELLERLGGPQLSNATLDKMIAEEKPFDVPEQAGLDTATLQRSLKELERMMELKKWNTPEVRELLLADLRTLRAKRDVAKQDQSKAVEAVWSDFVVPGRVGSYAVSPDSRYLVWHAGGHSGRPAVTKVYNLVARTEAEFPRPDVQFGDAKFTADGKFLVQSLAKSQLAVIPFENGQPNFGALDIIAGPPEATGITTEPVHVGTDSRYVYSHFTANHIVRWDLVDKTHVKLFYKAILVKNESVPGFGPLPGSSDLMYFLLGERRANILYIAKVSPKGELSTVESRGYWIRGESGADAAATNIKFAADGKKIFAYGTNGVSQLTVVRPGNSNPETIFAGKPDASPDSFQIRGLALSADGTAGAFLYLAEAGEMRVKLFDQQTHAEKADLPVHREATEVNLTADGTLLVRTSKSELKVYNPVKYTGE